MIPDDIVTYAPIEMAVGKYPVDYDEPTIKAALETGVFEGDPTTYLILGFLDESLEALEACKHNKNNLIHEIGDVTWYARMLMAYGLYPYKKGNLYNLRACQYPALTREKILIYLSEISGNLKKYHRGDRDFDDLIENIERPISWTLTIFNNMVKSEYNNLTLMAATALNINKLRDRNARGVIKGDGDKR
jgi:hypothetical protein